jgi:hypothetical protein
MSKINLFGLLTTACLISGFGFPRCIEQASLVSHLHREWNADPRTTDTSDRLMPSPTPKPTVARRVFA